MKLVVRADDFGFSKILNEGLVKSIEDGITTTVDMMLDTPGLEDACSRLKNYPWISCGWHTHFWWKPTLSAAEVPSLINPETGRFISNLKVNPDVNFEEAVKECRAEVLNCIRFLGRAPDTTDMNPKMMGPFEEARLKVCDEFGIAWGFQEKHFKAPHRPDHGDEVLEETDVTYPREQYKDLDIYNPTDIHSLAAVHQDSAEFFLKNYDPVQYYIDDPDNMKAHKVSVQPWHPGYVDEFVRIVYDNPLLNACRPVDLYSLCSERVKQWIREEKVELVNFRDAIHGTREYQNHLKAIGSDLAI